MIDTIQYSWIGCGRYISTKRGRVSGRVREEKGYHDKELGRLEGRKEGKMSIYTCDWMSDKNRESKR